MQKGNWSIKSNDDIIGITSLRPSLELQINIASLPMSIAFEWSKTVVPQAMYDLTSDSNCYCQAALTNTRKYFKLT